MSVFKRYFWAVPLGLLLVMWGCDRMSSDTAVPAQGGEIVLCGMCGEVKGSDGCCSEDADACEGCGLIKGSPGCCKMTKGTDAKLCPKCGEIGGSEACCNADAERCDKCNLIKGSPGCCKTKAA